MSKCSSLLGPPPHKYSRFVKTSSDLSSVFRESTLQSKHVKFEQVWKNKILMLFDDGYHKNTYYVHPLLFWALERVGNFSFTAAGVSIAIIEEPQSPKVGKTQRKLIAFWKVYAECESPHLRRPRRVIAEVFLKIMIFFLCIGKLGSSSNIYNLDVPHTKSCSWQWNSVHSRFVLCSLLFGGPWCLTRLNFGVEGFKASGHKPNAHCYRK